MLNLNSVFLTLNQKNILNAISLTLEPSDTLAIIGPSGCGKSSLLLSIAGIHPISAGTLNLSSDKLSLILQNGGLFPWKSAKDNILLSLLNSGLSLTEQHHLVSHMAQELKITHLLDKFPDNLSGGEKQRVAVARSLVTKPDLLLLDEPSSALDSMNKSNFQNLLLDVQRQYQLTFVIVTHNIEEALFLGKKIAIMHNGHIHAIEPNPFFGLQERGKNYDFYKQTLILQDTLASLGGTPYEK